MTRHLPRALVLATLSLSCEGIGSPPATPTVSVSASASAGVAIPFDPHEVEAVIDRGDDAANRHDAEAMLSLLDDDVLLAGSRAGPVVDGPEGARAAVTANYARSAAASSHTTRTALVMRPDATGTVVWFIADYDVERKSEGGGAVERRSVRESGVLARRNGGWRFTMLHSAPLLPAQPEAAATVPPDAGAEPAPRK
jgi:uncharacterized protein (TIGR02246 family)